MNEIIKITLLKELLKENNAVRDALIQGNSNAIREILKNKGFSYKALELEESKIGPFLDHVLTSTINDDPEDDNFVDWLLAGSKEPTTLKEEPSTSASKKRWSVSFDHLKAAIKSHNYIRVIQFRDAMDIEKYTHELKEILWQAYNDIYYRTVSSDYLGHFVEILGILCGEKGININLRDAEGETLLHKEVDMVVQKIWHADDDEIIDENGNFKENFTELLAPLLRNGADINLANNEGNTPFHFMIRPRNWPATRCWPGIKYLLQNGAAPNLQGQNKRTPLHLAIHVYTEYIDLIDYRENMNEAEREEREEKIVTLLKEQEQVITALLEAGADINLTDSEGKTPLHYAPKSIALKSAVLINDWVMHTPCYNSFFQWLPREMTEDVIEILHSTVIPTPGR